jgi:hypothetical protein
MVPLMSRLRLLPVLALLLATSVAAAQPSVEDNARALALGREALELYGKSDFSAAFEKFRAADRAAHSPVFVLYMARSLRSAGKLLAARELFAGLLAEPLPASAPEPWQRARDDAARELASLDARIPTLIIDLRGPTPESSALTLDEAPLAPTALRAPIRVDPGQHTLVARASGFQERREAVTVAEGDAPRRVDLLLVPSAMPPSASASATQKPLENKPIPPSRRGSLVPGIAALGVGVAGLSAGVITGVIAKGQADAIKKNCIDGHCLSTDRDKASAANALATGSTVSFLVGGAAAAAGVVLVILRPGGGAGPEAKLVPGPGSLLLTGSF